MNESNPKICNFVAIVKIFTNISYLQIELEEKQLELLFDEDKDKMLLLHRMATILKSCYMVLKGHGFATAALTRQYQDIIQDFQGRKKVKFHEIPDSGISSTTSISEDENKSNSNKRKIAEEPLIADLDGTFTMSNAVSATSTPGKPKSKGTSTDPIMSKGGGIGYNFFGGLASELINGVFYSGNVKKN